MAMFRFQDFEMQKDNQFSKVFKIDAEHFAPSATRTIPYGHQYIDEEDIQAVVDVLRSDYLTQGPKVREFEDAFAEYVGSRFAVAVSNGTAALHLACLGAELGAGDQVITSPITFVASANCALHVGATPAFVDIDPDTNNMDSGALETYLKENTPGSGLGRQGIDSPQKGRPKAIIPVHFSGLPCDMVRIYRLAKEYDLVVIEDACHALGGRYRNKQQSTGNDWVKIGSCAHSHMTVFSFHPVKHITTGEGGMVTTNDKSLYERLIILRNHGITRVPEQFVNLDIHEQDTEDVPSWYYEIKELGYNFRISDIQSALGRSQLRKVDRFVDLRRQIALRYQEGFKGFDNIIVPREPDNCRSAYHLFPIQVDFLRIGRSRQDIMAALTESGIGTQVHYIPVPHHPLYQQLGFDGKDYPVAERFYQQCLSLPIFPGLELHEVDGIIEVLKSLL